MPSSGVRTTLTPGAGGAAGAPAPGPPAASLDSLPPGLRSIFAGRLAAAVGNPDATNAVLKDISDAATHYAGLPNYRIMNQQEAKAAYGTAFDPTAIYAVDQTTGKPEVIQTGKPAVPLQDTPEGQANKVALELSQKTLEASQAASDKAKVIRTQVDELRALNPQIGGADVLASKFPDLIPLLQSYDIGTPTERAQMTAQQAYTAIASKLILGMRDAGIGRLSNMDLQFLTRAAPNIGQDAQSRQAILDAIDTMAGRQMSENSFTQQFFQKNHTTLGLDDAMEKPTSQGGLGPALPRAPSYSAPPAAHEQFLQSLRPGQIYVKPNGTMGYAPRPAGQ